jgi:hypothetical protein
MPLFPAIEPNTRSYDLVGDFPMVEEVSWPSTSTRYRTGRTPFTAAGLQMVLTYQDITLEQKLLIRDHYKQQQGGLIPFILPPIIFQGQTYTLIPSGTRWRYMGPPEEQDRRGGGLATITVTLEATAADYGAVVRGIRRRIVFELTPGIAAAANGITASLSIMLDAGGAGGNGGNFTVTASIDAGAATAGASIAGIENIVAVDLVAGAATGEGLSAGIENTVTVALVAGVASGD